MQNKYDVWYEIVTDHSIKRHFVAQGLPFRKAHELKRGHQYRHYIHVTQAAQPPRAVDAPVGACEHGYLRAMCPMCNHNLKKAARH